MGCVVVAANDATVARNTQSTLEMLQRSEVSNPPAFGAKIASTVLGTENLRQAWHADMVSGRIRQMREKLYDLLVAYGESDIRIEQRTVIDNVKGAPGTWHHLKQQTGMFGFLGLSPEIVTELRGKHISSSMRAKH